MTRVLALVGPTGSGKSAAALLLAERLGAEILSVDSMQVYRHMDIGTAKPTPAEQRRVPHHMIDLVDPSEPYTVAEFQRTARRLLEDLGRTVIVVGGSGLHFRAVVDPLDFPPHDPDLRRRLEELSAGELAAELLTADPGAGSHVDLANRRRVVRAVEVLRLTGLTPSQRSRSPRGRMVQAYQSWRAFRAAGIDPGEALPDRLRVRLEGMRAAGLLDEVAALRPRLGPTASQAVGYRQLIPVVDGEVAEDEGLADAFRATLSLARSQRTFFRRDPRISWVPWHPDPEALAAAVEGAWSLHALG